MLKIKDKIYSKLEKLPDSKHPWNVKEGIVFDGKFIAKIIGDDEHSYLLAEMFSGRFIRTSPINKIVELEDGGYKIFTKNSVYILV